MKNSSFAIRRLQIFAMLGLLLGCESGTVFVSHPQVNTRERLVQQRFRESQWLTAQLNKTDEIKTTFQGLRDFREFIGLYNELKASFNPTQGALSTLQNRNQEVQLDTEYYKQRTANLSARQEFLDTLQPRVGDRTTTATSEPTGSTTPAKAYGSDLQVPAATAPFGRGQTSVTLPDPSKLTKTEAEPNILDLFHDKMSYRDAVNSAIKANDLDDVHDFKGMTLYELNLETVFMPPRSEDRFAKVELEIVQPDENDRKYEIRRLFSKWMDALPLECMVNIQEWQAHVRKNALTEDEQALLIFMRDLYLPKIWSSNQSDQSMSLVEAAPEDVNSQDQLAELQAIFDADHARSGGAKTELETAMRNRLILIALARWASYRETLWRYVTISRPRFDMETGSIIGGLKVRERTKGISSTDYEGTSAGSEMIEKGIVQRHGAEAFVEKVYLSESRPYAMTIQPKEYAQNISEAAARESMVNLITALQATLPNSGVAAENQSQFIRRSQEYLHAITRKPLLIGFGDGEHRFGWMMGPSFKIEAGKASFEHRPIRHDVSATVVVPAWWNKMWIRGSHSIMKTSGKARGSHPLWPEDTVQDRTEPFTMHATTINSQRSGKIEARPEPELGGYIEVALRMPPDAMRQLTQALTAHNTSISPFERTSRPKPLITLPLAVKPAKLLSLHHSVAGKLPQTLLIQGNELWRNPEVFIGDQKADSIEILSSMEGLLATFDRVGYPAELPEGGKPDPVKVDLKVITAFGAASSTDSVTILPPIRELAPKPSGQTLSLVTPFVDGAESKFVAFKFKRPDKYGALILGIRPDPGLVDWTKDATKLPQWNAENTEVKFPFDPAPAGASAEILQANLFVRAQSDAPPTADEMQSKDGLRFVRFRDVAHRSIEGMVGAVTYNTATGKPDKTPSFEFDPALLGGFEVAYPGLVAEKGDKPRLNASAAFMVSKDGKEVSLPLSTTFDKLKQKVVLGVSTESMMAEEFVKAVKAAPEDKKLRVSIKYKSAAGDVRAVPVSGLGIITFSFSDLPATPEITMEKTEFTVTGLGVLAPGFGLTMKNAYEANGPIIVFKNGAVLEERRKNGDPVGIILKDSNGNELSLGHARIGRDGTSMTFSLAQVENPGSPGGLLQWINEGRTISVAAVQVNSDIRISAGAGGSGIAVKLKRTP